jgi:lysyl-tRNA synthetase, class II
MDREDVPESHLADHPLTATRLEKVREMRGRGIDPYPVRFERSDTTAALHQRFGDLAPGAVTARSVTVAGRIMLFRSFGKLVFATIEDVSGRIQLMCSSAEVGEDVFGSFEDLDLGDWIGAAGEVITTRKGELSVKVESFQLLAKALRPLPDKWHGLQDVEARSRRRYLDLMMNPESRRVALLRAKVVSRLRRQFEERGYVEVETPVLLAEAGGALARPFVTHHNALDLTLYLRIATELHLKRLVVGGLERVFEIGRIFRNEGIDATHNPEFTMLESYQALADYRDVMTLVEEVVSDVALTVTGSSLISYQGRPLDLSPPYPRARMVDMVAKVVGEPVWPDRGVEELGQICSRHGVAFEPGWGAGRLVEALFDELVEKSIWEPVFVLDHPVEISPLARRRSDDEQLTERFELFIAGHEYANAFSELNDPIDQRERFLSQAEAKAAGERDAHPIDEDYLMALEYGLPPTGGLGIGVDRLIMLLADKAHIREVILFPVLRPE